MKHLQLLIDAITEYPFQDDVLLFMKHLDVLDDAGLIVRSKKGRTVTVHLRAEPIKEAMEWLSRYERFWSKSLDRLTAYAEAREAETKRKKP